MKLVLNSVTYRDCPVREREAVALTADQCRFMLRKMHAEQAVSEAAILDTCNRTEFYLYAKKTFDVNAFLTELIEQLRPQGLGTWRKHARENDGIDVVRHLFEVAAGLDSQMVGENQILSQVKSAYALSLDCRMSKFLFHRLFHNAFRVGKAVRTDTNINCGAVSVSLAAVELAKNQIDLSAGTALVIGAGENAELAAKYLLKAGLENLIIANRDPEKAKVVVSRLKTGRAVPLGDIPAELTQVDLLIGSTAAAEPIVTPDTVADVLADRNKSLLIIDIAVPRDIDAELARFDCVSLHNIDDLNEHIIHNRQKRSSEIPKARAIVAEFTDKFAAWYSSLDLVPVITHLTHKSLDMARAEARRYAADFGDANHDKLRLFAESLVKKILHGPITFLKTGADQEPNDEQVKAADLINKMFLSKGKKD